MTGTSMNLDGGDMGSNQGGGASNREGVTDTYRSSIRSSIQTQGSMGGEAANDGIPKKEGHKWNAEKGEFEKLTEEEIKRM